MRSVPWSVYTPWFGLPHCSALSFSRLPSSTMAELLVCTSFHPMLIVPGTNWSLSCYSLVVRSASYTSQSRVCMQGLRSVLHIARRDSLFIWMTMLCRTYRANIRYASSSNPSISCLADSNHRASRSLQPLRQRFAFSSLTSYHHPTQEPQMATV